MLPNKSWQMLTCVSFAPIMEPKNPIFSVPLLLGAHIEVVIWAAPDAVKNAMKRLRNILSKP